MIVVIIMEIDNANDDLDGDIKVPPLLEYLTEVCYNRLFLLHLWYINTAAKHGGTEENTRAGQFYSQSQ